jgi:hypothetical protein
MRKKGKVYLSAVTLFISLTLGGISLAGVMGLAATPTKAIAGDCSTANCPGSGAVCCRDEGNSYFFGLIKTGGQTTYEADE